MNSYHLVLYDVVPSVFEEQNKSTELDNVSQLAQSMGCDIEFETSPFSQSNSKYHQDIDQLVSEDGTCRRCLISGPSMTDVLKAQQAIYDKFSTYAKDIHDTSYSFNDPSSLGSITHS